MNIDEAIKHCEDKSCGITQCNQEHKQLAEWLKELKQFKEGHIIADLRDECLHFMSHHVENEESVHQIVFTNTTIILNDEQMERFRG